MLTSENVPPMIEVLRAISPTERPYPVPRGTMEPYAASRFTVACLAQCPGLPLVGQGDSAFTANGTSPAFFADIDELVAFLAANSIFSHGELVRQMSQRPVSELKALAAAAMWARKTVGAPHCHPEDSRVGGRLAEESRERLALQPSSPSP
jgi:hypothetical protein